jgi:3-phosphoshikimate 1-carboxyvinyltransferase
VSAGRERNVTAPEHLRIRGGRPLRGSVSLSADLQIATRALVLAALGSGRSQLQDLPDAEPIASGIAALAALGVSCRRSASELTIDGVGLGGLRMPTGALDAGRSRDLLGLLAGLLSGQAFGTRIVVHPSLAARDVELIVAPLRARGAHIAGQQGPAGMLPPIAVAPLVAGEVLQGLDCSLPLSDPAAKTAILISALFSAGPTTVSEPQLSADHTERLLVGLGAPLRRIGSVVAFDPSRWERQLAPFESIALPGCTTQASYLACAAQLLPGSDIELRAVGINPTRSGVFDMLSSWSGAALHAMPRGDRALREPIADLRVRTSALRGGSIGIELLSRAADELPALALLGASARRGVRLCDLERAESLAPLCQLLEAFGFSIARTPGELLVQGITWPSPDRELRVDARDDPQLSLCACSLALACPAPTVVEHAAQALGSMYPGFVEAARALGAEIELV